MRSRTAIVDETHPMRLRSEFLAMPGLLLTEAQVARLLGIRAAESSEVLANLEDEGVLAQTRAGAYRLASPPMA